MLQKLKMKQGNILTENVIFIILNVLFIVILLLFVFIKSSESSHLEEIYAKKIALLLDSARVGSEIILDFNDVLDKAEKENLDANQIVLINGNIVSVKLREDGGYRYSFFNDVDVRTEILSGTKQLRILVREK